MTREEQMLNGFTEMMRGFWNNQDLKVPNIETLKSKMTIEEAIKHVEEAAKKQEDLYKFCPASESEFLHCNGAKDCKILKNGENKGCLKCAEEHRKLAGWLKELKQLREQTRWIPVSERLPDKI